MSLSFSGYRCAPISVLVMGANLLLCNSSNAQVQVRSSRLLRDVGMVTLDSSGRSQITINPAICRRLGPELCEFFKFHEMGHVQMQHLERAVPVRQAEAEADRYAAQHASPAAVAAARRHFNNGNGGSRVHGTPQQRAARLNQTSSSVQIATRAPQSQSRTIYRRTPPRSYAGGATPTVIRRVYLKPRTLRSTRPQRPQ